MRKLFLALVLLLLSGAAALWLRAHDGYVIVAAGAWRIETSLMLFAGAIAAVFIVAWMAIGLTMRTVEMPGGLRRWLRYRREGRARDRLIEGLLRTAEGRYQDAEGLLNKAAQAPRMELIGRILAAEAAQRAGHYARRDEYMALAEHAEAQRGNKAAAALRLMQAHWYAQAGQWEQALATLNSLRERAPHHPRVLTLLRDAALALDDWERLAELLPSLKRHTSISEAEHRALERHVAIARLRHLQNDPDALRHARKELPKTVRHDPAVVLAYAETTMAAQRHDLAEPVLRDEIPREWDPALIACYGKLNAETAESALSHAENWLKKQSDNPDLLIAVGQLAAKRELWARAQSYLEAAVGRRPSAQALRLLGEIQAHMGDDDAARESFQRALDLAVPEGGLAASRAPALAQEAG